MTGRTRSVIRVHCKVAIDDASGMDQKRARLLDAFPDGQLVGLSLPANEGRPLPRAAK